jgi:hypothetical protein
MQPLDLRIHPPRGPRDMAGGLCMLARTIDKLRATLPGGDLGPYHVFFGLSKHLADALGIDLHDLAAVVRDAQSEAEVVAWVRAHTDPATYDAINRDLEGRTQTAHIPPEARANFESKYRPELRAEHDNLFDLVEADDRELYAV